MKTNQLFNYLEKLELELHEYSFDELNSNDAVALKDSFQQFKEQLEAKAFGLPEPNQNTSTVRVNYDQVGLNKIQNALQNWMHTLHHQIRFLKFTDVNVEQQRLINTMERDVLRFWEKWGQKRESGVSKLTQISPTSEYNIQKCKVNLREIHKECFGDLELLQELIKLFNANALEFIGQLRTQLNAGDFKAIVWSAYKVRENIEMMRADSLLVLCNEILVEAQEEQDEERLEQLYEQFLTEYTSVELEIEQQKKSFKSNNG